MVKAASLLAGLPESPVLVVDTAPIIYWLEGHARFAERFAEVFRAAESGDASIVISTVTLAEVQVEVPKRMRGESGMSLSVRISCVFLK